MTHPRAVVLLIAALSVAGCGYFNSLYNARQKFADAQRAEAAGNTSVASTAYEAAISGAAASYRKYPTGRWADDALLLIARSHFGRATVLRNEAADAQAEAALQRLLESTTDPAVRGEAFGYLGAVRERLGKDEALPALDSAVALTNADAWDGAFARLWRARARFSAGDTAAAWADLSAVGTANAMITADAALEGLTRATLLGDTVRWGPALTEAVARARSTAQGDSIRALIATERKRFGAAYVRHSMPSNIGESLSEDERLALWLVRANVIAAAGDTASAIEEALRVGSASTMATSAQARVDAARWMLATANDETELPRIRATLVPAFSNPQALPMIRQIRTFEQLASRGDPLAMFIAAEYARDVLKTKTIARRTFLRVDSFPSPVAYAGKALLAALSLTDDADQRAAIAARMDRHADDVYVRAVRGQTDSTAYAQAETKLRRDGAIALAEAMAIAERGDVSVGRAVAIRDSVRLVLRTDSLRSRCLSVLDSMQVKGVRGDSARAACVRVDTVRFDAVLKMDTMRLKTPRRDTLAMALFHPIAAGSR